jgi:hypothetical protein
MVGEPPWCKDYLFYLKKVNFIGWVSFQFSTTDNLHYCTRRPSISFRGKTDCFSPKHRWPEDIAWHPDGDTIFAVYTADNGDSQVSMTNLISGQVRPLLKLVDPLTSCYIAFSILGAVVKMRLIPNSAYLISNN